MNNLEELANEHWNNSTRRLKVGVAFATILLLLYNVLLFLPIHKHEETTSSTLLYFVIFSVGMLVLAFLCIRNYSRGLSRFSSIFNHGGKRSLFLIRWGFRLAIAGVVLQILVFMLLHPSKESITFLWLLIGNILLIASAVVSIVGFLSLATSKGMPDASRRGALHMSWTHIVMLIGAILLSYSLQAGMMLKIVTIAVNLCGAYLFFHHWKRILNPVDESDETSSDEPEVEPAQEIVAEKQDNE